MWVKNRIVTLSKPRPLDLNCKDTSNSPSSQFESIRAKASEKQSQGLPSATLAQRIFYSILISFYWAINKKIQTHLLIDMKIINKSLIRAWKNQHVLEERWEAKIPCSQREFWAIQCLIYNTEIYRNKLLHLIQIAVRNKAQLPNNSSVDLSKYILSPYILHYLVSPLQVETGPSPTAKQTRSDPRGELYPGDFKTSSITLLPACESHHSDLKMCCISATKPLLQIYYSIT